jgi:uncharacterized protein YukJ
LVFAIEKETRVMPLSNYGVLKGTVIGHLRDADDDHYQILVKAGTTLHRIAVNVKSAAPNAPSTVLFQTITAIPSGWKTSLKSLTSGYKKLPSKPNGAALDYVRSAIVKPKTMKPVPPDVPGADNDLKDKLEAIIVKAMGTPGAVIYALGQKWGPEVGKPDKYFGFQPGNGIHDIHMNQGNSGKWKKDNGVYQDGALVVELPGDKWQAFFFAFQSQTFDTDDKGNRRRKRRRKSSSPPFVLFQCLVSRKALAAGCRPREPQASRGLPSSARG